MAKDVYESTVWYRGENCRITYEPIYCTKCNGSIVGFTSTIYKHPCDEKQTHIGLPFVALWEAVVRTVSAKGLR